MSQPTIFISGASKGIGLAIARAFYQQQFRVVICARGEAGLQAAKAEMPDLITYACDVANKSEVQKMATWLNEEIGPLEILVNNAGFFQPGEVHAEADEVYESMLRTNMDSTYYLTKGVIPLMKKEAKGTIFNIASIASLKAYANGGSYSISKFAMLGFSKNLREELKPHGIRVMSVMPGATFTASWEGVDVPEERLMPAEDVASMVWAMYNTSYRTVVEEIIIRPMLGDL
ncbi:MAG: SDR family oxidoreductase [Bacteroidota bacterium]